MNPKLPYPDFNYGSAHVPYELAFLKGRKLRNFYVLLVNSVDLYQEVLEMDGVD